jgi:hypothetical protein
MAKAATVPGATGQLRSPALQPHLLDGWFQNCLIDNWRDGEALVPSEWFENDA